MHAYLLITPDYTKEPIRDLIQNEYVLEETHSVKTIDEVRQLRKQFLFSPKETTLIVLTQLHEAKEEAQNAILKLIEEPPIENILFLIPVENQSAIIPTILSRVTVVRSKENNLKVETSLLDFVDKPKSEWFGPFSKITDRDDAIHLLNQFLETKLLKPEDADQAIQTIEALKKNGSVVLQLTRFLIS